MQQTLFVSVVMPVRNEAPGIGRVLGQLSRQAYDASRFEIIVIDGESTDGTPEIVRKHSADHENVRLFSNPRRLSSAARNIGIRAARGEVIVIVDGHCDLEDDQFLARLASTFLRSGADCVGRPQPLDVSGATTLQRSIALARSSWLGHHPDSYVYSDREEFVPAASCAAAYRRAVFDRVGYFDEGFDACEDYEFNVRADLAGLSCFFTPDATVRYRPRDTLRGLFCQLVRYGRGRVRLLRKHPGTASLGTLIPAAFVLGLIVGLPLSCLSPWLAMAYWGTLAAYAAIVISVCIWIMSRRGGIATFPCLPVAFVTIHVACGTGTLLEWVAPGFGGGMGRRAGANGAVRG